MIIMKLNFALFMIIFAPAIVMCISNNIDQPRHKRSDEGIRKNNSRRNSTNSLISVTVQLSFVEYSNSINEDVIPAVNILTASNGTTAFDFLRLAAKQNPCYRFQYKTFSFGRYITKICCVAENTTSNYYWFIYVNDAPSPVGVDQLKPSHGDILRFEYRYINYNASNHHDKTVEDQSKTGFNLTDVEDKKPEISVSVGLTFTDHPSPNVIPLHGVTAASNATAFKLLQLAAKLNPCYNFRYKQFSFGRYITTICCVEQNMTSGFYWFVYINGKRSPVGVDLLKPKDGDTLTFQYEQWKLKDTNYTTLSANSTTKAPATRLLNTTPTGKAAKIFSLLINVYLLSSVAILFWTLYV